MSTHSVVSVRLETETWRKAQWVALVDDGSTGELIRQAVHEYLDRRMQSPEFQSKVDEWMKMNSEMASRVASEQQPASKRGKSQKEPKLLSVVGA